MTTKPALSDSDRQKLAALVAVDGTIAVAARVGISERSIERALAALKQQPGTVALIARYLGELQPADSVA